MNKNKIQPTEVNTIKILHHFCKLNNSDDEGSDISLYEGDLNLMSVPDKGVGLYVTVEVNGVDLHEYIDPYILVENMNDGRSPEYEYSEFYVLSCSCGVAGCAGIHDGVYIDESDDNLYWRIPVEMGYQKTRLMEGAVYSFNKEQYIEAFNNVEKAINQDLKRYKINPEKVELSYGFSWKDLMVTKKKKEKVS